MIKNIDKQFLIKFLGENQNKVSGLSKGYQMWTTNFQTYLNSVQNLNKSNDVNNRILHNGEMCSFSKEIWITINDALNNSNMFTLTKRKHLTSALTENCASLFEEFLKFQNKITSMLYILSDNMKDLSVMLSQLFADEYANILHITKTEDISFNRLSKNIGKSVFYWSKQRIKVKDKKIGIAFIRDLLKYNIMPKDYTEKQNTEFLNLFMLHFNCNSIRYLFSKDDFIVFAKTFTFTFISEHFNDVLIAFDKKSDIPKAISGEIAPLCSIFIKKENRTDRQHLVAACQILDSILEIQYIAFGASILNVLDDKIIIITSALENKKRTSYTVRLKNEEYYIDLPSDLPIVYYKKDKFIAHEINTSVNENSTEERSIKLKLNRKKTSSVKQSYYIKGTMLDKKIFDSNAENTKFAINIYATYIFFDTLFACQECFSQIMCYYNTNNAKIESDAVISDLQDILAFIGQMYEVNFLELWKTCPVELISVFLKIIANALDFNQIKKISVKPGKNTSVGETAQIKNFQSFLKKITDVVFSRKVMLNEFSYQLFIMSHFDNFMYNWSSDSRGRKQMLSILSLQGMPILRFFVSFYNSATLHDCAKDVFITKTFKKNGLKIHKNFAPMFREYHATVLNNAEKKLSEFVPSRPEISNIFKVCQEASIGKAFIYISLALDLDGLNKDINYKCKTTAWGLDSTISGFQQLAMFLKNYNLARFCNLVRDGEDAYKHCERFIITIFSTIASVVNSLVKLENMSDDEISNLRIDYLNILFGNTHKLLAGEQLPEKVLNKDIINKLNVLITYLKDDLISKHLLSRQTLKVLVMVTPYNASPITAKNQMLQQFLKICRKKGFWVGSNIKEKVMYVIPYIYKLFLYWVNSTVPQVMLLRKASEKFFSKDLENIPEIVFNSPHFSFMMHPLKKIKERIQIPTIRHTKVKRLVLNLPTSKFDYKKYRLSLVPHIVHHKDSAIVSCANKKAYTHNINKKRKFTYYMYTVHDCFFCPISLSPRLIADLRDSYKSVFKYNLLDTFNCYPAFYNYVKNALKNDKKLELKDLCEDDKFVK